MLRTFKYRIYPTKAQIIILRSWLRIICGFYNDALQERRDAWQKQRKSIKRYDQQKQLTEIRNFDKELASVSIYALRGALRQLELAFQAFSQRCINKEKKVGYPRFKNVDRWNSLIFDDAPQAHPVRGKYIYVSIIGLIKANIHRPCEGVPKTLKLHLCNGKWYALIGCEVEAKPLPTTSASVGVDLGLIHFAATSDGHLFPNPRPFKHAQKCLARAQRRIARRKAGSNRRRKAVLLYAKQAAHVAAIRRENHIAVSNFLVRHYDRIYIEALNIKGLANGFLAKHVRDAAWGGLQHWLRCKAESAGREVVEVDPRGTSQRCSWCDCVVEKKLSDRIHRCDCGLILDRDINAAMNILRAGLALRRDAVAPSTHHRPVKLITTKCCGIIDFETYLSYIGDNY